RPDPVAGVVRKPPAPCARERSHDAASDRQAEPALEAVLLARSVRRTAAGTLARGAPGRRRLTGRRLRHRRFLRLRVGAVARRLGFDAVSARGAELRPGLECAAAARARDDRARPERAAAVRAEVRAPQDRSATLAARGR